MLNRLFGNYLVNRGYLEPAQLDNLLESINGYKADPETVILINKFLTLSQIQSIQQSQAQEESFTDAALRLQMLTDNQIEQIIQFQSLPVMCFAQLLLDRQILCMCFRIFKCIINLQMNSFMFYVLMIWNRSFVFLSLFKIQECMN